MRTPIFRRALTAALAAGLLLAACGDDDSVATDDTTTTASDNGDGHDHGDTEGHEVGDSEPVPTIALSATPAGEGAVDLEIEVTNLTVAPQGGSAEHVAGEGHVHVLVDGKVAAMISDTSYHIEGLSGGEHEITVGLSSTDHQPLLIDGEPIEVSETVTVEGEPDDGDAAADMVIEVEVAGGDVEGGGRHAVSTGDTVTIRVTSDVADEIHLHGYDLHADVEAGQTGELTFDATIPGVFEVELEDAGLPLLEIEVS